MRTHPVFGLVIGELLQLARFWLCVYIYIYVTIVREILLVLVKKKNRPFWFTVTIKKHIL